MQIAHKILPYCTNRCKLHLTFVVASLDANYTEIASMNRVVLCVSPDINFQQSVLGKPFGETIVLCSAHFSNLYGMVVNGMQLELDYIKIGRRIKAARLEKGLNQSDLGAMVGCSNNHMSHVEVGQTKVSLSMLVKLSVILEKDFDYFLLDTPYVRQERIINSEISEKLKQCSSMTLVTVSKILDALLEQQEMQRAERDRCDD